MQIKSVIYIYKIKSLPLRQAKKRHKKTGDVLISQAASHQVSSALKSLTSVFGMGTGVTSLLLSPDYVNRVKQSTHIL